MIFNVLGHIEKMEAWHGDIMAMKSLLPRLHSFIYFQKYINSGDIMSKLKRICKQCGREFERYIYAGKGGKYCSVDCYNQWRSTKKIKKICEQCGRQFEAEERETIRGNGRFCSTDCHYKWQSEFIRGENHPLWKRRRHICEICGREILVTPSQIKKGWGRFCSRNCYFKWRSGDEKSREFMRQIRKAITKPTKPEKAFKEICKNNNLPFRYVGDGQFWIGRKKERQLNPDFIEVNGKKICVEVMGDYWHSPLLNRNMKEYGTRDYRKQHYKRFKWQPIFLWESDLKRKDAEAFVKSVMKRESII